MANLLDRFRSISRPSLTRSSGTYSSLAKQQASAEDLLMDNLYAEGSISIESYTSNLNARLLRTWNTPRTILSIQEKIDSVNNDLVDSEIDRAYQAGEITTRAKYELELGKLNRIKEPGSQAWVNQSRTVQTLLDKAEKEDRSNYRIQQLNQLSTMPDDTSEKLWQKASIYETLAQQAQLDGDSQQAITLSTQANNYKASAKRAEINDYITDARLQVSQTPTQGLGVPGADGSSSSLASGGTGGGYSGSSSAVKSAMTRLDRQEKALDRMYGQREDKLTLIEAYQQAVPFAEGDQKTSLTIALNNLVDDLGNLDNSIAITTASLEETMADISSAHAAAYKSDLNKQYRSFVKEYDGAEKELDNLFRSGQLSREEYVAGKINYAQDRMLGLEQFTSSYEGIGDESSFNTVDKIQQEIEILDKAYVHLLNNVAEGVETDENNKVTGIKVSDNYVPMFVDEDGTIDDLNAEGRMKGDVILKDVSKLKAQGNFDQNYTNVNGVYHRIYYGQPVETDEDGFAIGLSNDVLQSLGDTAFVFKKDGDKIVQDGIEFVLDVDVDGKQKRIPMLKSEADKLRADNLIKGDKTINALSPKERPGYESKLLKPLAGIQTELQKATDPLTKQLKAAKELYANKDVIKENGLIGKPVKDLFATAKTGVPNFVNERLDEAKGATKIIGSKVKNILSGIKMPQLVPSASASELTDTTGKKFANELTQVFGKEVGNAYRTLQGENAGLNPRAINKNRDGSEDRGLFQINSNTFVDFQRRKGNQLASAGIKTYEDMFDPVKNAKMAKIILEEQGWKAWYGAPEDLRKEPRGSFITRTKDLFGVDAETKDLLNKSGMKPLVQPEVKGRTVGFQVSPGEVSSQQNTTSPKIVGGQRPNQVQNVFDMFKPKLISPLPEAPRPKLPTLLGNTVKAVGSKIATSQPRLNVSAQAKALPEYTKQIVVPKVKSAISSVVNLFKRK